MLKIGFWLTWLTQIPIKIWSRREQVESSVNYNSLLNPAQADLVFAQVQKQTDR